MTKKFSEIDVYKFGHTVQMVGAVFAGDGETLFLPFPGETIGPIETVEMTKTDWDTFNKQVDHLETEVIQKASDGSLAKIILRKSQRQISLDVSWRVFRRDGYTCCYCGCTDRPLTVDHLITWEDGGPSTPENLLSVCPQSNRTRGRLGYKEWLASKDYERLSRGITAERKRKNADLLATLDFIPRLIHKKSR